jgi:transcriptional regulator with XRE-family HTH domain
MCSLSIYFDRNKLIALRKNEKISLYELSMRTGIEASTLMKIEKGVSKNPRFLTVSRLAEYFSVQIEYFKFSRFI